MSIQIDSPLATAIPTDPILRLSVEQYHQMIAAGILTEDDRVELLEGWLIPKMTKNPPHVLATQLARDIFTQRLPIGWIVGTEQPITTPDSEPEPDLVVIRGERRDYAQHHAEPKDVALIVEISDATLQRDHTLKKRLYARAGIPTYWIVNLVNNQVEVYTEPSGAGKNPDYAQRQDYRVGESITIHLGDGQSILIEVATFMP